MLLLALMPHHSGQGKAGPGCGATMMDSSWARSIWLGGDNGCSKRSSALGQTLGAPSATSQQLCWFSVGAMHRETTRDSCSVIAVA